MAESQPLHPAYRLSGLARPVDPTYSTNMAMAVLAVVGIVVAAIYAFVGGANPGAALLTGLNVGLIVFFSWALTRELSPDDNPAAFVAVALALAVWPRVGAQSILLLAAALLAARLVNRSTGKAAELGDTALATVGFAALAWWVSWTVGVVGAVALSLDAVLARPGDQPARRRHLGCAVGLALVTAARVIVGVEAPKLPAHLPVFASIAGLCALAVLLYPRPSSVGDVDRRPLSRARVRGGLAMGLLAAALVSLDGGIELERAAALWACVLAVPLGLPIVALRRRSSNKR
ncbi:hypothetical protein ENSA5_27780 [Enhygromyxa salina]|uniref:Uncharacterized protein n=1 Tax=Enhygromyxa salina TaxID=215803 RepID=A0A2S9Y7U8_9BACT|nr:hypothetical protein [Enhygromyxa salina]PRQ01096.1 hypothetical protein ENSA5_27780 [Enhygromyxa salina]